MLKVRVVCKSCGHTFCPDKEKWERPRQEPDCPNDKCPNYGVGFRGLHLPSIWETKETINPLEE